MSSKTSKPDPSVEEKNPILQRLLDALRQDKDGLIHLPENTYVELHEAIEKLEQAKVLAGLSESLLNLAVNLDHELKSESASTHIGLLAKAAAEKAINLNSSLTTAMDRISNRAAQYQRFNAQSRPMAPKLGDSSDKEGVVKLSDLDPNRKKA